MKIVELNPDQIITLNDFPVHSLEMLKKYFDQCQNNEPMPLVPVISLETVRGSLSPEVVKEFEQFVQRNPLVQYFMLDGSHRTTAAALIGRQIKVAVCDHDDDFTELKKMVASGEVNESGVLDDDLEQNIKVLNDHFASRPGFMTVKQKMDRMIAENFIPSYMLENHLPAIK